MAKTSDRRFMQVGDKGILIFNVEMRDERHVTKDKPYPMTITAEGYGFVIEYTNDVGEVCTFNYYRQNERDGYETIQVEVTNDEFTARVNALRSRHADEIYTKYVEDITRWNTYCDDTIAVVCGDIGTQSK